jgi:hypothetical protein
MPLLRAQAEQLYAAGTVPLPPQFPEAGILTRTRTRLSRGVVCVEHRTSTTQVARYYVPIGEVRAVVDVSWRGGDPEDGTWYFGREAHKFLRALPTDRALQRLIDLYGAQCDRRTYGIVFVRKNTGVLVQEDRATSADDVEADGWGCCCKKDGNGWGCCKP